MLGRNSSRGGGLGTYGPGPREFSYTDKQTKTTCEGGFKPLDPPLTVMRIPSHQQHRHVISYSILFTEMIRTVTSSFSCDYIEFFTF